MKRVLPLVFALASLACATTPAPAPVAAPIAVAAPADCDPGLTLLNASLWVQTAAEYRASALQTFRGAQRGLDATLDNPFATGALEETSNDPSQPPAVILDLDETILDNSAFEARMIREHKTYEGKAWKQWTSEGAARAIPGAKEFLAYAKSRGVTIFYVTNRDVDEEAGTRANLEKLGFPLETNVDTLLMQGKNGWTTGDKSPRRAHVAAKYRILLLLGDDLNDFAPASGKTLAERNAIVDGVRSWWGETWFILPNPMYGSWERAVIGSGATPCEAVQRKIDGMRID
ncbi:MAG TPA: HAD family acid phosphatase [Thermoanaerobaculia bacterium]|jgi:acid phosphatase|nr:HAD family acid phosphatase [Thermoanaerobaculia bacterium]